jgi:hypothetical protein
LDLLEKQIAKRKIRGPQRGISRATHQFSLGDVKQVVTTLTARKNGMTEYDDLDDSNKDEEDANMENDEGRL